MITQSSLGDPGLTATPQYRGRISSVNLTNIHTSLKIDVAERDMWLTCMEQALHKQDIEDDLKIYLLNRFRIPAEKIRATCQEHMQSLPVLMTTTTKK